MAEIRKLYRSRTNRQLAGVCGGLAEYFTVDPTLIRVLFVVFALLGGPGLVAYLVLWIVVPEQPSGAA
jgi:phage shock protein C